jgi:hypothetical protein
MPEQDAVVREKIRQMLAGGLLTQTEPVPEDNLQYDGILNELYGLSDEHLERKLEISGFIDHPRAPEGQGPGKDEQRCYDCMYYLVHRRWCALPPLSLPVEPEWWCRLWRV